MNLYDKYIIRHAVGGTMLHAIACGAPEQFRHIIEAVVSIDDDSSLLVQPETGSPTLVWSLTRTQFGLVAHKHDGARGARLATSIHHLYKKPSVEILYMAVETLNKKQLVESLKRADAIFIKDTTPQTDQGNRAPTKKTNYTLDEAITFGKYGPNGQEGGKGKPGRALLIREIIKEHPGWIYWALDTFGIHFLTDDARNYYYEHKKKAGSH